METSKLSAARLHYAAKRAEAEETIKVYLRNSAGIGEHPQIMEELRKQVEIVSDAQDQMNTIDELISKYENSQLK
jgi:hypothetical protein